jgi:hypothetical protein
MEAEYKPASLTEPPIEPASTPSVTPEPRAAMSDVRPVTQPASAPDAAPEPAEPAPKEDTPATPPKPVEVDHLLAPHSRRKHHHMATIIVAIVLFLILASIAVMTYIRTKDDKVAPAKDTSQATTDSTAQPKSTATTDNIDGATTEIDKQLGTANDDTDFNATDLSDTTLSL